jgi:hypothetical protein
MSGVQLFGVGWDAQPEGAFESLRQAARELERNGQHRHELLIISCYVNFESIRSLTETIADEVKLTRVVVLFDYNEVFKLGPAETAKRLNYMAGGLQRRNRPVSLDWGAVRTPNGALIHAKGYAIVQRNASGEIVGGTLLTGSANLTQRGFGLPQGVPTNIELGYTTARQADIKAFVNIFEKLLTSDNFRGDLSLLKTDGLEQFKYALLSSGMFLNKWSGNLNALVGMRFPLSHEARRVVAVTVPELRRRGFHTEQNTLTKNYLDLSDESLRKNFPRQFTREYTIETSIGRWCPKPVWEVVEEILTTEHADFLEAFRRAASDDHLDRASKAAESDLRFLVERNLVRPTNGLVDRWAERLKKLRDQEERLRRIWRGYSAFPFPFRRDEEHAFDVYDSLRDSIDSSMRSNLAIEKVEACEESHSLRELFLTGEELTALEAVLHGTASDSNDDD